MTTAALQLVRPTADRPENEAASFEAAFALPARLAAFVELVQLITDSHSPYVATAETRPTATAASRVTSISSADEDAELSTTGDQALTTPAVCAPTNEISANNGTRQALGVAPLPAIHFSAIHKQKRKDDRNRLDRRANHSRHPRSRPHDSTYPFDQIDWKQERRQSARPTDRAAELKGNRQ